METKAKQNAELLKEFFLDGTKKNLQFSSNNECKGAVSVECELQQNDDGEVVLKIYKDDKNKIKKFLLETCKSPEPSDYYSLKSTDPELLLEQEDGSGRIYFSHGDRTYIEKARPQTQGNHNKE